MYTIGPADQSFMKYSGHHITVRITKLQNYQAQVAYPSSRNESLSEPPGFLIIWIDSRLVLPCHIKQMQHFQLLLLHQVHNNNQMLPKKEVIEYP